MRPLTQSPAPTRQAPRSPAFSSVLCAVDGTHASFAAVAHAAALAGASARLTLLVVTASGSGSANFRSAAISPQRASSILERAARIAAQAGVSCERAIDTSGPPAAVILGHASSCDLLAIGAPARSPLGTVGAAVVRATLRSFETPLLLGRRGRAGTSLLDRVLIASDGTDSSEMLVAFTSSLLGDRVGELVLVNAVGSESHSQPHRIAAEERLLREAHKERVRLLVEPGNPASVILHAAEEQRATLVVLGSRRLSGIGAALGSVSRRVVRELPCTALVLPPERLRQNDAAGPAA